MFKAISPAPATQDALVTMYDLKFPDHGIPSPDTPSSLMLSCLPGGPLLLTLFTCRTAHPSRISLHSHLWTFHQQLAAKQMLLSLLKYLFVCLWLLDCNLWSVKDRTCDLFSCLPASGLVHCQGGGAWGKVRSAPLPGVQPRVPSQPGLNLDFHHLHRTTWLYGVMGVGGLDPKCQASWEF